MSRNSHQPEGMEMRVRVSFEFKSGLADAGVYGFRQAGLKTQIWKPAYTISGFEVLSEEFQPLRVGEWGGGNDTPRLFFVTSMFVSLRPVLTLPTTPSQHHGWIRDSGRELSGLRIN